MNKIIIPGVIALVMGILFVGVASAQTDIGKGFTRMLSEKAEILGMSEDDLKSEMEARPFYQIAREKGFTRDSFREKMQAGRNERIQEMVNSGWITQEQADEMKNTQGQGECVGGRVMQHGANW